MVTFKKINNFKIECKSDRNRKIMNFRDKTKSQLMYQANPGLDRLGQNERLMDRGNPELNKCAKGGRYFAVPIC